MNADGDLLNALVTFASESLGVVPVNATLTLEDEGFTAGDLVLGIVFRAELLFLLLPDAALRGELMTLLACGEILVLATAPEEAEMVAIFGNEMIWTRRKAIYLGWYLRTTCPPTQMLLECTAFCHLQEWSSMSS